MSSARRASSSPEGFGSPGEFAMEDGHDLGLLGSEALDAFGQDELERELQLQSTGSRSSSVTLTRLPRCAVLNFQKVGDCVNMRPRAVTDTGTPSPKNFTSTMSLRGIDEGTLSDFVFLPRGRPFSLHTWDSTAVPTCVLCAIIM